MKKSDFGGFDVFRLIAAWLVVAIHTSPLTSFGEGADFFLTRVLARLAVPFFFMVTGQFVLSDVVYHREVFGKRLKRYILRLLLLYGASMLLYLPVGVYAGHYSAVGVFDVLRMVVFDGTFYHLWYFPACIIGILLIFLFSRRISVKTMAAVAGALYLFGLLGDSYFGLTKQIPVLAWVYERGFLLWSYTRNGIFFAPLFLLAGAVIGRQKKQMRTGSAAIGFGISFLLLTAEAFILRAADWQRHDSMYVLLVPAACFLYCFLWSLQWKNQRILRTTATWIYILHPLVIVLIRGAAKLLNLPVLIDSSLLHYTVVVTGSSAVSFLLVLLSERFRKKRFLKGRAWIELDRAALRSNVLFLRSRLPKQCELMPAVKANAYGHGAVIVSKELQKMKVKAFCVACVKEGIELRKAGILGEILILGYTHREQLHLLRKYRLTQTIVDFAYAEELSRFGKRIHVHIGVDTGMHRLGIDSRDVKRICRIFSMKTLSVDGMFTHLSASDLQEAAAEAFTRQQVLEFGRLVSELKKHGIACPKVHIQASYGVLNYPDYAGDYARVGIALYGCLSLKEDTALWRRSLKPVLSLKARIAAVRNVNTGEYVGYGLDFTAGKPMKIAVLAVGYADGLPRELSNGVGAVLIAGRRAPIIGRICMDQTLVDVSGLKEVSPGDTAVLIGRFGEEEITACDLAGQAGTIANEILSRMGARLERMMV